MCVFVPVSTATLPLGRVHSHTPRGSLPAYSVFNLGSCINLILYNQVEGGWDTQTCSCRAGSDRGVAAAAVAVSIGLSLLGVELLEMACFASSLPLFLSPLSLSSLSCAATAPGACGLGRASPFRFRGRLHRSTWQDTYTTATNLGQISCRGI